MSGEDERKLFVAGLPDSMSESALRQIFEATGAEVVDVSLPRDRETGRARGFGFVTLGSEQEASRARSELDGTNQGGRSMSVRPFQPSGAGGRPDARDRSRPGPGGRGGGAGGETSVYVGNLPYGASQGDLAQLVESLGIKEVGRIHLPLDPQGRARGFGFVAMPSAEAAEAAASALAGAELQGRKLNANVAQPRGAGGPRGGGGYESRGAPRGRPGGHPGRDSAPRDYGSRDGAPRPAARGGGAPEGQPAASWRGPPSDAGVASAPAPPGAGGTPERSGFDEPRRQHDGGRRWSKDERKKKKKPRPGADRSRGRRDDSGGRWRGGGMDDDD